MSIAILNSIMKRTEESLQATEEAIDKSLERVEIIDRVIDGYFEGSAIPAEFLGIDKRALKQNVYRAGAKILGKYKKISDRVLVGASLDCGLRNYATFECPGLLTVLRKGSVNRKYLNRAFGQIKEGFISEAYDIFSSGNGLLNLEENSYRFDVKRISSRIYGSSGL